MLIHTLPPRRMCRVMAIRADSICRLVTYAGSRAWMAYSPKLISVPPLARPERLGWCCLRCLTRRGISMASGPLFWSIDVLGGRRVGRGLGDGAAGLGPAGSGAGRARTTLRTLGALAALLPGGEGLEGLPLGTRTADVALVDPHLHADAAEGGAGLVQAVVDVRAERVQRHATLAVELRPAHLGTAEAARALHPDALDLRAALGRLHGLAHGAAEADAARELL